MTLKEAQKAYEQGYVVDVLANCVEGLRWIQCKGVPPISWTDSLDFRYGAPHLEVLGERRLEIFTFFKNTRSTKELR
jgi:hypothetical protein